MNRIIIITILSVFRVQALLRDEWTSFLETHGKVYSNAMEEQVRMQIFAANKEIIEKHNNDYDLGKVSYKMKMNRYGDLMLNEFTALMNGYKRNMTRSSRRSTSLFRQLSSVDVPESIDWRTLGAVTPVKNQGHCGSCWAFSSTGALEGQHFRKTGKLLSLSEQYLVDCSTDYGNQGCEGGIQESAFQFIKDNHGIVAESAYPYEAKDKACRYNPSRSISSDNGYVDLPENDEDALKAAIATVGPISVSIDAAHNSFKFYSHGVYYEPECSTTDLDHAVLAVGYGTMDNGDEYWIVKNSWGEDTWGDGGYIKMARNRNNNCGIATNAVYPLV